jgi:hypothetical protein
MAGSFVLSIVLKLVSAWRAGMGRQAESIATLAEFYTYLKVGAAGYIAIFSTCSVYGLGLVGAGKGLLGGLESIFLLAVGLNKS